MGTFTHLINLLPATGDVTEVEALVDTGSTFTSLPRPLLERLGVRPIARIRVKLANGQSDEADVGEIPALIDEYVPRTIICAFSPPDAPAILGAHTLGAFLLDVDPLGKRLVPVDAMWAHESVINLRQRLHKENRDTCGAKFPPKDEVEVIFIGRWFGGKLAEVWDSQFSHRRCLDGPEPPRAAHA